MKYLTGTLNLIIVIFLLMFLIVSKSSVVSEELENPPILKENEILNIAPYDSEEEDSSNLSDDLVDKEIEQDFEFESESGGVTTSPTDLESENLKNDSSDEGETLEADLPVISSSAPQPVEQGVNDVDESNLINDDEDVQLDSNNAEVIESTPDSLTLSPLSTVNVTLDLIDENGKNEYYTGETEPKKAKLSFSSSAESCANCKVIISVDKKYCKSFEADNITNATKSNLTVSNDGLRYEYIYSFLNIDGGTSLEIPIKYISENYTTPHNFMANFSVKLIDSSNSIISEKNISSNHITVDMKLIKRYQDENLVWRTNISTDAIPVGGIPDIDDPTKISANGATYISYNYVIGALNPLGETGDTRNIGGRSFSEIIIEDELAANAVFDASVNSGWTYDDTTRIAKYVILVDPSDNLSINGNTIDVELKPILKLRYPGGLINDTYTNNAKVTGIPINNSINDKVYMANDDVSHYITADIAYLEINKKPSVLSFPDSFGAKSQAFKWNLFVNNHINTKVTDFYVLDKELDQRMKYTMLSRVDDASYYSGEINVYATVNGSEIIVIENMPLKNTDDTLASIDLPENATQIRVEPINKILEGNTKFSIDIYTKIKDPITTTYSGDISKDSFHNTIEYGGNYNGNNIKKSLTRSTRIIKYEPQIVISKSASKSVVFHKETVRFYVTIDSFDIYQIDVGDKIESQVIVELLPEGFKYNSNSFMVHGKNYFDIPIYDMFINKEPIIIPNYKNSGKTGLVWNLKPATKTVDTALTYKDGINILYFSYSTSVEENTYQGANYIETIYCYANNFSDSDSKISQIKPVLSRTPLEEYPYTDEYDVDEDGNKIEKVLYAPIKVIYSLPNELYSVKKIKGSEDNDYLLTGGREEVGKNFSYKISVTNQALYDQRQLVILDVLPRVKDKSIVPNSNGEFSNRNSEYDIHLASELTLPNGYIAYYNYNKPSDNESPESYSNNSGWLTANQVGDFNKVVAIKIVLQSGNFLKQGDTVEIEIPVKTLNDVNLKNGMIAVNSFAYTTNNKNFVEAKSSAAKLFIYNVSGTAFYDDNKDGLLTLERPVSNIKVSLLDENNNAVLDLKGNPITAITDNYGRYSFDVYSSGKYKISFSATEYVESTVKGDALNTEFSHINPVENNLVYTDIFDVGADIGTQYIRNAGFLAFGDLKVSKTVVDSNNNVLLNKGPFKFEIKIDGSKYNGSVLVGDNNVNVVDGIISIKGGESFIIRKISVNSNVSIAESEDLNYTSNSPIQSIKIEKEKQELSFINVEKPSNPTPPPTSTPQIPNKPHSYSVPKTSTENNIVYLFLGVMGILSLLFVNKKRKNSL